MKLAIVTTHPIQYNAPLFKQLSESEELAVKVFYTWEQSQGAGKFDPEFGRVVEWDIPLLEGYEYTFVKNISKEPGSHHFKGIDNPTLNKEIETWGADAILVYGWAFKSHLKCMRYFKGKTPILFRGDSTLLDDAPGLRLLARRLFLRYVYSFIDYALYVGENNKQYFLAHGVRDRQLVFAPHAVDNKRFSSNSDFYEEKASAWKKELGVEEGETVVLFAGKFNTKKNPHFVIDLAQKLDGEKMKFIFIGNGELENELKERTKDDKRFVFLGFQNQGDMPVVYRLCDIFILPSVGPGETWGLAINEAMSCGKAVISTDKVGCSPDMVVQGKNGIVVDTKDVESAKDFVLNYLKSPSLKEVVKEVNEDKLKTYSYDNIVLSINKLVKKL